MKHMDAQIQDWCDEGCYLENNDARLLGYIAQRAAAWAREQALEEAAKVCEVDARKWRTRTIPLDGYASVMEDCAQAIRALKEKANEHAPIPR